MYSAQNAIEEGEICDTLFGFDLQINPRTCKKNLLILHGVPSEFVSSIFFCFCSSCLLLKKLSFNRKSSIPLLKKGFVKLNPSGNVLIIYFKQIRQNLF